MCLSNIRAVARLFFWSLKFLRHFFPVSWGTVSCFLILHVHRFHCAVPGLIPTANMSGCIPYHKPKRPRRFTTWSLRQTSAPEDGSNMFVRHISIHLPYSTLLKVRLHPNVVLISRTTLIFHSNHKRNCSITKASTYIWYVFFYCMIQSTCHYHAFTDGMSLHYLQVDLAVR